MRYLMVLVAFICLGCTSNMESEAVQPAKEKLAEPVRQAGGVTRVAKDKKELLAVLCSAKVFDEAVKVWEQKGFALVKKTSSTIVALSWHDGRTSDEAVAALQASKALFCGVEVNQTYTTQSKLK